MKLYFDEIRQKWMVEDDDGTIREATPEELEAAIEQWQQWQQQPLSDSEE